MQQPAQPAVVKRFVEGETSDLPCKRSRTEEKDITTTPQNLAELSGAVVRSQIPQHQPTSPLVANSAHGTPDQPHTGSALDATANKQTIEIAKHFLSSPSCLSSICPFSRFFKPYPLTYPSPGPYLFSWYNSNHH